MEPLPPPLPAPESSLHLPGFTLGHGTDLAGKTGVTVILCPDGALAAAEVRGSATGTRQFDSLVLGHHVASKAHAVVLAGGSGYGLSAADPAIDHLRRLGKGFKTDVGVVPLVPTSIIFDLGYGDSNAVPTRELVEEAIRSARDGEIEVGSVGVGTGATVGKARGRDCAMKGGFGFASLTIPGGPTVAAAVAVNAFGDVRDPDTGRILAGCRAAPDSDELVGADRVLAHLPPDAKHPWHGNSTLGVIMTNAAITKPECLKVCQMAFGAFYRTLVPALAQFDGDLIVTLTSGEKAANVNQVGVLAERALAVAVIQTVQPRCSPKRDTS